MSGPFSRIPTRTVGPTDPSWWNTLRDAGVLLEGEAATRTTTSGGTTTLTAASTAGQLFDGISNQSVVLPNATTLTVGRYFRVINRSSGTISVYANDGVTLLATVAAGASKAFIVTNVSTSNGTWTVETSSAPITVAEASAIAAEDAADDAAASAAAAASSASGASSSASAAATSETIAGNSASAAATSATNAGNSATAAAGSATTASTQASNASSSASAAATSATNAGNSATAAAASASSAAADAALVAAALNFQHFYIDTVWSGQTTQDISVAAFGTDARQAQWSFHENGSDFERLYYSIKAISSTVVRVTSNIPLSGTYRLLAPTSAQHSIVSDTTWTAETTKDINVSASIPDARMASWQFLEESGGEYEQVYYSIKAISSTVVRVTSGFALTGTYRLIGKL